MACAPSAGHRNQSLEDQLRQAISGIRTLENEVTGLRGEVDRLQTDLADTKRTLDESERERVKLLKERDDAIEQRREWQLVASNLQAEGDRARQNYDAIVALSLADIKKKARCELLGEWTKSEALWKDRLRNERAIRQSYERVLLNLGYTPNRIASDLIMMARTYGPEMPSGYVDRYPDSNVDRCDFLVDEFSSMGSEAYVRGIAAVEEGIKNTTSPWQLRQSVVGDSVRAGELGSPDSMSQEKLLSSSYEGLRKNVSVTRYTAEKYATADINKLVKDIAAEKGFGALSREYVQAVGLGLPPRVHETSSLGQSAVYQTSQGLFDGASASDGALATKGKVPGPRVGQPVTTSESPTELSFSTTEPVSLGRKLLPEGGPLRNRQERVSKAFNLVSRRASRMASFVKEDNDDTGSVANSELSSGKIIGEPSSPDSLYTS